MLLLRQEIAVSVCDFALPFGHSRPKTNAMFDLQKTLTQYVGLRSISAQSAHKADCQATATWVLDLLKGLGFGGKLVPTGGHPLVMATFAPTGLPKSVKIPHVVVYGHYDVQPPEPLDLWKTDAFTLTKKGGKLYGRGSADNKGPTLALIAGLASALEQNPNLPLKITTLIEGEEEIGSAHLHKTLAKLKKQIGPVDAVVLSDTGSKGPNDLIVTTGVRGVMALDVQITALKRDLHSGHGGPVPNAVRELTRVMGSLYRPDGMVSLPGFYKGITKPNRAEVASMNKILKKGDFAREIGAKGYYSMKGMNPFVAMRFLTSIELNGVYGGYQGEGSKTIIPAQATAKLTCRIAPGQDPAHLLKSITGGILQRINKKLFDTSIEIIEAGLPAYAAPLPHLDPAAKTQSPRFIDACLALESACVKVTKRKPLYLREGASIPVLSTIATELKADSLMLGLFTEDSFLHSPNENVSIKLLENGSKVWAHFFTTLAQSSGA